MTESVFTIEEWQAELRRYILRSGQSETARIVGVSRGTVTGWMHPDDPSLPRNKDVRAKLEVLMGIRRRRSA